MLVNMSAGAFLDETAAPEEVQEAREKNKQGLRTYYDHMVPHYEMLEKKYGHELPDLMWVVQNYDEFLKDFANPQVDNNLVTHDTDVLNREDEKDLRAISLVQFYNSYCGAILVGIARIQNSESFPIKDMDEVRGFMKQFLSKDDNYQKNLDFLKAHPINDGGEAE